jgi:ribosomal protein S25
MDGFRSRASWAEAQPSGVLKTSGRYTKLIADMQGKIVPFPKGGGTMRTLDPNASHARIYSEWRHLDSYKTLTLLQKVILQDILMDFSKAVGNEVRLTGYGVSVKYGVSQRTARSAIAGLEERGWIDRVRLGPGPTGQTGGVYEMLCIGPTGKRIAGPYLTWKAPHAQKRISTPAGSN